MTDFAITAICVGLGVILASIGFFHMTHVDRKIKARGFLLFAAGGGVQLVAAVIERDTVLASVNAVTVAAGLYGWWYFGGGDGMRRTWKKLQSLIPGRLAPQAG